MTTGGITLAFDIYGTLADTSGVARALAEYSKDAKDAAAFAARWRDKQLEYTFRRTAMGHYADFGQCTAEALLFVCAERGIKLSDNQRGELAAEYSRLPLFADAKPALIRLRESGNVRMFAFSNGKAEVVREWLKGRGILDYFADIVSADEVQMFKPAPQVYKRFLHRAKGTANDGNVYLVSGNPFDIIGAQHAGIKGLWLNRAAAHFDPWQGVAPAKTITSLAALADIFAPPKHETPPKSAKHKTYQVNGKFYGGGRPPGLGRMVYDIIKHWADKNRPDSFGGLTAAFPQTLRNTGASTKDSLFAARQEAEQRYNEDKDHPRHVRSKHALMTVRLGDGSEYAVTNQWGEINGAGDIRRFIAHARKMGYGIEEAESASAVQPVKIHVFIDMENIGDLMDNAIVLSWLRGSGLSMTGMAVHARGESAFQSWQRIFNKFDIEKTATENTGKDAVDAVLVGEIAVATRAQKAGDIICIVSGDQIFNKAAESALKSGFRVIQFGKDAKPSWNTSDSNYRFFNINDFAAEFPEEWKTRPAAKN